MEHVPKGDCGNLKWKEYIDLSLARSPCLPPHQWEFKLRFVLEYMKTLFLLHIIIVDYVSKLDPDTKYLHTLHSVVERNAGSRSGSSVLLCPLAGYVTIVRSLKL
jgi:hypothetical protein